jgi:hypothetical protein
VKTKIFLQRGLDTPVKKPPDGQITTRQREHIARVPDAVQRFSRCSAEPGPMQQSSSTMDPDQKRTTPLMRVEDARKRADGAAQHPRTNARDQPPAMVKRQNISQVMQRPG